MDGVYRTRVGYTGGEKEFPTYYSLGNHTESLQIDYDPSVVSYDELLDVFFAAHNPYSPPYSVQYKSAIYYANDAQRVAVEAKVVALEAESGKTIETHILPLETFYVAEDYHHKHNLRKVPLLIGEFEAEHPTLSAFLDDPAVTWANGYVSGCGDLENLLSELPYFGLSPEGEALLKEIVEKPWLHPECSS